MLLSINGAHVRHTRVCECNKAHTDASMLVPGDTQVVRNVMLIRSALKMPFLLRCLLICYLEWHTVSLPYSIYSKITLSRKYDFSGCQDMILLCITNIESWREQATQKTAGFSWHDNNHKSIHLPALQAIHWCQTTTVWHHQHPVQAATGEFNVWRQSTTEWMSCAAAAGVDDVIPVDECVESPL